MKNEKYIRRLTIYQVVYTRRFTTYQVAYIRIFAIYQVVYTRRFTIYRGAYTCGIADQKSCMRMHTLSCIEKRIHVGKLIFGSVVFRPMVLDLGIASEVMNLGIGSLVLVLNGFGPWY